MKLEEETASHPGDKRHLAEDQGGAGAPWGTSNNRETRKSGSSWNSTSCYPLKGGGTEGGWQCLQTPVCATEAAGIKMEIGMR